MTDIGLTYHFQIWGAEMGTGKSLSAIELIEKSGKQNWFWIGPKSGLYAVEREFKKWGISDEVDIEIMTYEGLVKRMTNWPTGQKAPQGVIFDESSRAKNPTAKRTMAAQALADGIRKDWGLDGYVILMSGTPSPKSPLDWWAQSEIAWPGYLKEGSQGTFGFRLGVYHKETGVGGTAFHKLVTWKDSELKCDICGELAEDGKHNHLLDATTSYLKADPDYHDFKHGKNEIAYLYERLKGLAVIKHKKDCLDLPDKRYRIINCEPKPSTLRVAQALLQAAPNTITGLTWLRELSDGFQYRNKIIGKETCPVCEGTGITSYWVDPADSDKAFTMTEMLDPEYVKTLEKQDFPCASCGGTGEVDKMERTVKEVPCPKEDALINLLDENEETGRLVVFAGFTGSIDKITALCLKQGWDVVRVDGRGWQVRTKDGILDEAPLDYWADLANHQRVCFVAHPKSGGMGLTLTESRMAVYYSNSYETESRTQSEDRIHRIGTDLNLGATIVDLIHLPTDLKVLELIRDNRRLELMSMGDIQACFEGVNDEEGQQQS
jgi:SNF2 family DNA or RNA helicase